MPLPSFINRNRLQQTVYHWAQEGLKSSGNANYIKRPELRGRWEDRSQQFYTRRGDLAISSAVVFLDQPINAGDLISLSPNIEASFVVRGFSQTPNLRNMTSEYKAML